MKRYLILALIVVFLAAMLVFWRQHSGESTSTPDISEQAASTTRVVTNSSDQSEVMAISPERALPDAVSNLIRQNADRHERMVQMANQGHDTPVAFYGLVVDQDSNALSNVIVDLAVVKWYTQLSLTATSMTSRFQRPTGADGRFEVTGVTGNFISVEALTKDGYEPELERNYGSFGPQSTTFDSPAVLKLWSTNVHEQLITGAKSFVVIPDGRHYAIDLLKGTIAEGDQGDLVAWIKRPDKVKWGQRYDWSTEVTLPAGGLIESGSRAMFVAPEAGYTNVFACQEDANLNGGGPMTGDKRFYVRLRNGQMYGRITINLYADFHGKQPGMIQVSYTINPSGSRLLR